MSSPILSIFRQGLGARVDDLLGVALYYESGARNRFGLKSCLPGKSTAARNDTTVEGTRGSVSAKPGGSLAFNQKDGSHHLIHFDKVVIKNRNEQII